MKRVILGDTTNNTSTGQYVLRKADNTDNYFISMTRKKKIRKFYKCLS